MKKFLKKYIPEPIYGFLVEILNSYSQIMLQEHPITGLFFIVGIFTGSLFMGLSSLLAVVTALLTARFLKFDVEQRRKGIYGFSAALSGVALILYFDAQSPIVWLTVVIASIITPILQDFFQKKNIPVFTFPFVLVTMVFYYAIKNIFPELLLSIELPNLREMDYLSFTIKGFGQVIFQTSILAGLLFFHGVLISSPVVALFGLAGAFLSAVIALQLNMPLDSIFHGLFSFNAVLTAIVFSSCKKSEAIWFFLAVVLTALISVAMTNLGVIQLTLPFVIASFTFTLIKRKFAK